MDVQAYIGSGILEEYCTGFLDKNEQAKVVEMTLLYPEIKLELTAIELALEKFAAINAIVPIVGLRRKIFSSIDFDAIPTKLDLNNLPPTDKYSDYTAWLEVLAELIPDYPTEDFLAEMLQHTEQIMQMLVVTKNDVPEETHEDVIESFFILKGCCQCTVGEHLYTLNPGDFLEIPLHTEHDIKIISPYVIGILQHRAI